MGKYLTIGLEIVGGALIAWGVSLISPPAALIVTGILVIVAVEAAA